MILIEILESKKHLCLLPRCLNTWCVFFSLFFKIDFYQQSTIEILIFFSILLNWQPLLTFFFLQFRFKHFFFLIDLNRSIFQLITINIVVLLNFKQNHISYNVNGSRILKKKKNRSKQIKLFSFCFLFLLCIWLFWNNYRWKWSLLFRFTFYSDEHVYLFYIFFFLLFFIRVVAFFFCVVFFSFFFAIIHSPIFLNILND